jgi:short-subunit dehydrogenase involved in D-alanine esterification of teichoic acids
MNYNLVRGLGLEFAKQLLQRTNMKVIGLHRSANNTNANILMERYPSRFQSIVVDLEDQVSVEVAGNLIAEKTDRVDILLNIAGILGDGKSTPGPERSLGKIDRSWLKKSLEVNKPYFI